MVGCQGFGGDTGGTGRILLLDLREADTQAFASLHGRSEFSVIHYTSHTHTHAHTENVESKKKVSPQVRWQPAPSGTQGKFAFRRGVHLGGRRRGGEGRERDPGAVASEKSYPRPFWNFFKFYS